MRYDVLGGEGLEARVRELLLHLGRRRRFDDLLDYLERTRPNAFPELGFGGDGDAAEGLYASLPSLPSPDDESSVTLPVETERRGRNWQFVLRALAVLSWVVAVVWFLVEGGFEPLLAVLSGVGFFLGSFAVDGDREKTGPDDAALMARNRRISRALVEKVRAVWIRGVLEQNLHEMARLELDLVEKASAVERPWAMALERGGEEERPLPPGTPIDAVFRELGGAMLILGAPGSGKTITLLELAERMLAEAEHNASRPVPLVLNLSSWAERRLPLAEWLVEEMHMMYGVSKRVSPAWLATANYALLLDGLDEVAAGQREACVEAINAFHRENGFRQIAVCSRTDDYERLRARLQLTGAVDIRPLTPEQVDAYLAAGGRPLAAARAAVATDALLRELAKTPLTLNVIALAYHGRPVEAIGRGSLEERRRALFAAYVERMFERRPGGRRYAPEEAQRWLAWLARRMQERAMTVFYVEYLQPDWLERKGERRLHRWLSALVQALLLAPFGALVGWSEVVPIGAPVLALVFLLVCTLLFALAYTPEIALQEERVWSWPGLRLAVKKALVGALVGALVLALGAGPEVVLVGALGGLTGGILIGALEAITRYREVQRRNEPNQGIWQTAKNEALEGALIGALIGALGGALIGALIGALGGALIGALVLALVLAFVLALIAALTGVLGEHFALRFLLARYGYLPFNLVPFLDAMSERILLRKVGGGYAFVHRMLLDYFADLAAAEEG